MTDIKNKVSSKKRFLDIIFHKLVLNEYNVNSFYHYRFFINNRIYKFGLLEMIDLFGDDFLHKSKESRTNLNKNIQFIR